MRALKKLLGIFFLVPFFLLGQETGMVTGTVVNANMENLAGASVSVEKLEIGVLTDSSGKFSLALPSDKRHKVKISFASTPVVKYVILKPGEKKDIGTIRINTTLQAVDIVKSSRIDMQKEKIAALPVAGPNASLEKQLVYTNFASSNNELSSTYNVRGGNFDENLIYVNGFEVFRPFLTRSGQQEGMSFIHTALVDDIQFSAGGFGASYGDKLSSVLDVKYRKPERFKGSFMASLLGVEGHVEGEYNNSRGYYLLGGRFRSNGYLLNALPTQGEYNPRFWDVQGLTQINVTERYRITLMGHFSSNDYRFIPESKETTFGTVNQALSLNIYYDGQEQTLARTMFGGMKMEFDLTDNHRLEWYNSIFNSDEKEYFDVQGQYYINELENDPGAEDFGDSVNTLGVGSFLEHGRNRLNGTIYNTYLRGIYETKKEKQNLNSFKYTLNYGVKYQREHFNDVLSEWNLIDSAGYSIPQAPNDVIELSETIKSKNNIHMNRFTGYAENVFSWSFNKAKLPVQFKQKSVKKIRIPTEDSTEVKYRKEKKKWIVYDTVENSKSNLILNVGVRGGYLDINNDYWVSPRMVMTYIPRMYLYRDGKVKRRGVRFRFAAGLYQQPPFYREMRDIFGNFNPNVKNQKSVHAVLGTDIFFNMWERKSPFKFTAEAYYKYLWDVNPYEIDNVRLRYYADNNARAYAYGLDMKIHGQFIKGIESYFKIGFLSTKEDILDDSYVTNYNQSGEVIIPGYTSDDSIASSTTTNPGYIPRPSDQLFTLGVLFQDRMPKFEQLSVSLSGIYGSKLPYGPPGYDRYKDTLRAPSYFRIDVGFQYDFLYKMKQKKVENRKKFWNKFDNIILSFEIFNLFGFNNVISHRWVEDVEGRNYAVPNYLTGRRFNVKLNISW